MASIAACYNVYNDVDALRGSLELSSQFFDNIFVLHTGPSGKSSDDGTIELCEEFGCRIEFASLDDGFGVIRSRLIHECECEWAFILDADERFYPAIQVMECIGTERYPQVACPNLRVNKLKDLITPGYTLRSAIEHTSADAIRTIRRHWFDFTMMRPSENWSIHRDYQLRIVRNKPYIGYRPERKMHEHLIDSRSGETPSFTPASEVGGPFHDHFHLFFRTSRPGHKEFNEENYQRLDRGELTL